MTAAADATGVFSFRLDGLEPDNLLAFLALLGLLRAIEADDRDRAEDTKALPRAAWDIAAPPLRPRLHLIRPLPQDEVMARTAAGLRRLAASHRFDGKQSLNYSEAECRKVLEAAAEAACVGGRDHADLLAALISDAAIKDQKKDKREIDPTPLCLLTRGQQANFLERLSTVPNRPAPPKHGRGKAAVAVTEAACLNETLFKAWHNHDLKLSSFRWDPAEDVRYALLAGDPTDDEYKGGAQHGANRLAAVGLAALTLAPERRAGRVPPTIVGGHSDADGFSFAWPIWRAPASLAAIRALLSHPEAMRNPGALCYLGVA